MRTMKNVRIDRIGKLARKDAKLLKNSMCSVSFLLAVTKTVALVLFYYSFSIGLTFYNKKYIGVYKLPLSITMVHLVIKFILAWMVRGALHCYNGQRRVILPWSDYIKKLAPTGIASALDIGLSNWSFEFITISLYTMSKSTCIIFILGFALLFKLEKFRWSLIFIVAFIAVGLFLFTYHATQFNDKGFALVLSASFVSGLRWTLAQFVCQKNEIGLGNPIDMMYHVQPWMILSLLPLSAGFEIMTLSTSRQFVASRDYQVLASNCLIIGGGAVLAFMLEFSEFLLLCKTSSLTLSISGILKELCTLFLAHVINGDKMSFVNSLGLVACLCGITLHVVLKAIHRKQEGLQGKDEAIELLLADENDSGNDDNEHFNQSHL